MQITVNIPDDLWEQFKNLSPEGRRNDTETIERAEFCMITEMQRRVNDPYIARERLQGEDLVIYDAGTMQGRQWARETRKEHGWIIYRSAGYLAAFHCFPNDVSKQKLFFQGWHNALSQRGINA